MSSSDDGSEGNSVDMISSKKEYDEQNNVNNITEGIDSVVLNDMSTCAACGKEGNNNDMNTCNKCKSVKYCNAACKKKHRKKHKKECEKRVTELHDEQLFKEVEPEECPICFLILPGIKDTTFKSCCGKIICNGCNYSMVMSEGKDLCAFCRMPPSNTSDEQIKRIKKLMESGNSEAFNQLAGHYAQGTCGLSQNWAKANELMLKAGELGCAGAYFNLGCSYRDGDADVEIDMRKARHYFELAAMEGNVSARYNLGFFGIWQFTTSIQTLYTCSKGWG